MRNNEEEPHGLREEERVRAAVLADLVIERIADRYNIDAGEVVESLRWVREHREFVSQLKSGGIKSVISLLLMSAAVAIWEGIKSLVHK